MKIRTHVRKLSEFVLAVAEVRFAWPRQPWEELWFRGENKDYRKSRLYPGLYRPDEKGYRRPSEDLIAEEDRKFDYFRSNSGNLGNQDGAEDTAESQWKTYFQMQQCGGQTRLLDWTSGALMALHYALLDEHEELRDRFIYVLDPYWLIDWIDIKSGDHMEAKQAWEEYCQRHPEKGLSEKDWDDSYLPSGSGHDEIAIPNFPVVLNSDHLKRQVAAQRSQFVLMGRDNTMFNDLMDEVGSRITAIAIDKDSVPEIRVDLRDLGITDTVVAPELDDATREARKLWAERLREI